MSQNRRSFDLGKQFYLNLPDLKNYVFWSNRTDSQRKPNLPLDNAYFAILSQNQKHPEKCVHVLMPLSSKMYYPIWMVGRYRENCINFLQCRDCLTVWCRTRQRITLGGIINPDHDLLRIFCIIWIRLTIKQKFTTQ